MTRETIEKIASGKEQAANRPVRYAIASGKTLGIYPRSINRLGNVVFLIAQHGGEKSLYVISSRPDDTLTAGLHGETIHADSAENDIYIKECPLIHPNVLCLQKLFYFTRPVLIGTDSSFGLGDRLGLAGPGHIRAITGTRLKPVLAQQSIRELERTGRRPEEVMDAAVWAVFQEGYRNGFGADADHLKTAEDIDLMAQAGFTMFTFDPGAYVDNDAGLLQLVELQDRARLLDWDTLDDTCENFMKRYENVHVAIAGDFSLKPEKLEVLRGIVKYGNVIAHTVKLYRHLKDRYPGSPSEVELSVDETNSPTTPFEHFLVVNELKRLGVKLASLAPRFIGDFEKGIDYKGDLTLFGQEYRKHLGIAEFLGPYKISLHSGSDKFSIYDVIGKYAIGLFHVKTAGTSYLVALQTIASVDSGLFRKILDFARGLYDGEKKSYHVSADAKQVPPATSLNDEELLSLFDDNHARQVLHVTFGKVLTSKDNRGEYIFKDRILKCLKEHEDIHYTFLENHIRRHLRAFL